MELRRLLLFVLAGSLALCAVVAIVVVITGAYNATSGRILMTILSVGFYSLAGLCCTPHLEQDIYKRRFAQFGLTVAGVGLLHACATNWLDVGGVSGIVNLLRFRVFFFVLAIAVAHVSLLLMITPRNSLVRGAQYGTIVCSVLVAVMLLAIIYGTNIGGGAVGQTVIVLGILDALGSIVTPILHIASKA